MTKWNQSKSFNKLKAKWYGKLKKSGFEDQEHDEQNLKQFSGLTRIRGPEETDYKDTGPNSGLTAEYQGLIPLGETYKYNYYLRCREFLGVYKFKNKSERKIFEMHSEGMGIRVIAVEMKTYKNKIHEMLKVLIKEMRKLG